MTIPIIGQWGFKPGASHTGVTLTTEPTSRLEPHLMYNYSCIIDFGNLRNFYLHLLQIRKYLFTTSCNVVKFIISHPIKEIKWNIFISNLL